MILVASTYWAGAPFDFRRPPEDANVESLVLRAEDHRQFRALYWTPRREPKPRVAVVCMHPRVDFTHHYTFPRLLAAGVACLGANGRNGNDDTDTEHEALVLDVAACVRWLRARRGVEKVVLLGNCGGGSLAAFYQAQAISPAAERLATSPGGTPTRFGSAEIIPGDGLILTAPHRGQGKVLGDAIDPSITDESDPLSVDPALDMYDSRNGFRPPPEWCEYDPAFVARYRAAQLDRVRRLDAAARSLIERARVAGEEAAAPGFDALPFDQRQRTLQRKVVEHVMVVYRTMANPSYVDRRIDPSPREYGSLLSDRPDLMNVARLGLARTCTPRAWLSTWSALSSNADLVENLAAIRQPTLVVSAARDRELYPKSDVKPIADAVVAEDRTILELDARHYFEPDFGQREAPDVEKLMDILVPWIQERFTA